MNLPITFAMYKKTKIIRWRMWLINLHELLLLNLNEGQLKMLLAVFPIIEEVNYIQPLHYRIF